jgi:hypothetical protein
MEESEIKLRVGVDAATLNALTERRLLRADRTPEATYYELSHDSLINPVVASKGFSFAGRAIGWLLVVIACSISFPVLIFGTYQGWWGGWLILMLMGALVTLGSLSFKKFSEMGRRAILWRRVVRH